MVTAAQAYDGGEGSAREFDCEPATRQATTTTSNERDYCCSHSQPASIALLAGVSAPGYIVGGSWPSGSGRDEPAAASGLALRREDGCAVQWDNGLPDLHTLEGWQHWRGWNIALVTRLALGIHVCVCVRRYRHGRRLLVSAPWGIAPRRPLPSLLLCCWGSTGARASTVVAVLLDGDGTFSSAVQDPRLAMARERRCRGVRWLGIE